MEKARRTLGQPNNMSKHPVMWCEKGSERKRLQLEPGEVRAPTRVWWAQTADEATGSLAGRGRSSRGAWGQVSVGQGGGRGIRRAQACRHVALTGAAEPRAAFHALLLPFY